MRINLRVAHNEDLEALERGHPAVTFRLYTYLRLRLHSAWSDPLRAIVDTGSAYSVVPHDLADKLHVTPLYRTRIGGLVPNEFMKGTMAEVACMATDGETTSDPFTIRAILADQVGIPLILGVHGLLDKTRLTTLIGQREAWIDHS